MKANELMMGDWVVRTDVLDPHSVQVARLEIDNNHNLWVKDDPENIGINFKYIKFEDCHPIPLTPELLEKNGLANDPYGCHFKEDEYMALEISVEEEGVYWTINYNEYSILKLKYVHQLQHALKLCGIDKEIVV